ncbi:MAG: response regulator [Saccharospirillaceae bacterium]|nr:response regulator [Saccharospirillaceae bacterium]
MAKSLILDSSTKLKHINLLPYTYVLSSEYTPSDIKNISSNEYSKYFRKVNNTQLFQSTEPEEVWLAFSIISNLQNSTQLELVTEALDLHQADLYQLESNHLISFQSIGNRYSYNQLGKTLTNYDFPITIYPGENRFYINIKIQERLSFPIFLSTSKSILLKQKLKLFLVGIACAFTLILILFCVWLRHLRSSLIPKSTFLLLFSLLALQISNANIFTLIFTSIPNIDVQLRSLLGVLYISGLLLFSLHFSKVPPLLYKIICTIIILTCCIYSLLLIFSSTINSLITISICLIFMLLSCLAFIKHKKVELRSGQMLLITYSLSTTIILVFTLAKFNFFGSSWSLFLTTEILMSFIPFALALVLFNIYKESMIQENPSRDAFNSQHWPLLKKINHDLRSPINAVLGMSELLQDMNLSVNQQNFLNTIQTAGFQLLNYVDEIQNLVRIGNQSLPTKNQEINLNQFINQLINPYLRISESKSIEIIVNTATNLPSSILANEKLLLQTMRSILDNAVNFTESGEIEVQVILIDKNNIRFIIRDSGNGISQEILKNIFEFSSWDAKNHQRSHLGLPISKVLVEKMGGKLHLISDSRNGTKVWMDLPLVISEQSNIDPLDYQALNNIKVLIVDDNSTCRKVLESQTADLGMRFASANNGQTAIAMLRSEYQKNDPFDLLLLDHQMPNMTGVDLLQRIRNDHKVNKNIKTIILTGLDINIDDKLLQKEDIYSVLNKPISSNQLRNHLLKAIEQ